MFVYTLCQRLIMHALTFGDGMFHYFRNIQVTLVCGLLVTSLKYSNTIYCGGLVGHFLRSQQEFHLGSTVIQRIC